MCKEIVCIKAKKKRYVIRNQLRKYKRQKENCKLCKELKKWEIKSREMLIMTL